MKKHSVVNITKDMVYIKMLPTLNEIEQAAEIVYSAMPPTPQYCWPLLSEKLGAEVWVKHENHTPTGAFKIRGGLVYFAALSAEQKNITGVISATRGNHGQSVGLAAKRYGIPATIVVPHGNSKEKNAAMRALGVNLIEFGNDFQESKEYAEKLAQENSLHMVQSFHRLLVAGVATYCLELFRAVANIDIVYVPIGLGSGVAAMLAARNALGLKTEVVGVVSAHARAYAESFIQKQFVESPVTTRIADGMACRTPNPDALDIICNQVDRIVEVTDAEIATAIQTIFECTHNISEGAGAAAMAAALQEKQRNLGRKIAVVLTGGNIDRDLFIDALNNKT
ncbi:serine/threonine dehydratase [Cellvibrio zantedeschiae]|uniref:Serine/threonine dehydratase n=1 Tax=Cellvibrio zantedeschiae TaxID=1237077 RepID=A0ABQ3BDH3_9GAMM|nr:threonine dehydratase [Cellvibrio zantedeschiae]GGY88151.1 serine/threonine dehydratase [Cellvibrio zantedeschiae]